MYEVFEKVINEEENNQYEEQEDEYELEYNKEPTWLFLNYKKEKL